MVVTGYAQGGCTPSSAGVDSAGTVGARRYVPTMTSSPPIIDETEGFLRERAAELTSPRENECLCCYVARMLDQFPCDGSHRHAFRYRDAAAPRATALAARLSQVGACCCDCELLLNGYQLSASTQQYPVNEEDEFVASDERESGIDDPLPPCQGVRRGSVRPCRNWARIRR